MLNTTKTERRKLRTKANDFLQLMIDAGEKEILESSEIDKKIYLDDDTIDAQSLLFLIAGYETSSTLLSFAIHVLAAKSDIQNKLRTHIKDITEGKEMSYELLAQLDYLEGFLLETLRMYPPLARVDRICTKEYILPGTSIKIEPGNVVAIPVYGIQMDPDIYPEPNEFIPERFTEENKKERPSHLFLAFGAGPRNCIGKRFAMISAKLAMVALLKKFKFSLCEKSVHPVVFEKKGILLKAANGLWVHIENINQKQD
ncbi:Cytochrome P450 6a8 [Eumeta japonica]|uniref:unspecific monooxygenase n=1 Tax=Eumeta variegata TaxID=151549 RepID=A0A4C1UA20_EUMVA|nr:Cytochrome P450 6a8 [Eumeta japonica]